MADQLARAAQLVAAERARDPRVVELARLLSLAVQIEPELIRAMRLTVLTNADAGVEADLWFSALVAGRDPDGIALLPDVAELLRRELAGPDNERVRTKARQTIESLHASHSPMLLLEEAATYFSVLAEEGAYARMEREIGRAVAALETSSGDVIARWAARTLPRMPEAVRTSEPAIALARRSARRLGGLRVRGVIEAGDAGADWDAQLLARLPKVVVGVRLTSTGLEISHPPSPDSSNTIEVPHTDPLVLETATPTPAGWQPRRVTWQPGTMIKADVTVGPLLRITTAAGAMQTLRVDTLGRRPTLYAAGAPGLSEVLVREANNLDWALVSSIDALPLSGRRPLIEAYVLGPLTTRGDLVDPERDVDVTTLTENGYVTGPEGLRKLHGPAQTADSHLLLNESAADVRNQDSFAADLRRTLIELDIERARTWIAGATSLHGTREPQRQDFITAPYPGLRPFGSDEARIFFGRSDEVRQMQDILLRTRRLLVSGPAGVGTTSLLRAGLMASLHDTLPALRWQFLGLRPAVDLLDDAIRYVSSAPADTSVLLVVDQFEEIFRTPNQLEPEDAVELILQAERASKHVYTVLCVRADFRSMALDVSRLARAFEGSDFPVPPMTRDRMREAIVQPARVVGGAFEPGVVERLLDDVGRQSDALPLLQYTLNRLWNVAREHKADTPVVTMEHYDFIGGIHALNISAEQAFAELRPEEQRVAEGMFRRLTTGETRTPTRFGEVAAVTGATPEALSGIVERFRRPDRAFILPPFGSPLSPETVLDIGSHLLVREWERLRDWTTSESTLAGIYRDLLSMSDRWSTDPENPTWTPQVRERAREWQAGRTNSAWAERYGGGFERVAAFVNAMEAHPSAAARSPRQAFEYTYFVSYSHADLDNELRQFLHLLRTEVGARTADDPARIAFMDTSIKPGELWSSALATALQRSAVMVSILSPAYFGSEWLGKEVQFFSELRGELQAAVVPVVWRPVADTPRPFSELQLFASGMPDAYRIEGARAMGMRPRRRELRRLVEMLADTIVRLAASARERPAAAERVPDFEHIQSAWRPQVSSRSQVSAEAAFVQHLDLPEAGQQARAESIPEGALPFDAARQQAAIVGSDIICFVKDVAPERRQDIVNVALLAQLVANKKVGDLRTRDATLAWNQEYRRVLSNLGFVIQESGGAEYSNDGQIFEGQEAILDVLKGMLAKAPAALTIVVRTIESLKTLSVDSPWIMLFHRESRSASSAHFQVWLVDADRDGLILSLVAFRITAKATLTQVLFFRFKRNESSLLYDTAEIRVDERVLDAVRDELAAKVAQHRSSLVAGLNV